MMLPCIANLLLLLPTSGLYVWCSTVLWHSETSDWVLDPLPTADHLSTVTPSTSAKLYNNSSRIPSMGIKLLGTLAALSVAMPITLVTHVIL
jgi:hypothetical protein